MSYYESDEIEDMVRKDVEDAWEGEGEYVITYTDGGQAYEPRWYGTSDELADDLRGAYADATETHLPYAERVEREEPEGRTKADFAALRETVGLTQANLADDLGVQARSVRRWSSRARRATSRRRTRGTCSTPTPICRGRWSTTPARPSCDGRGGGPPAG